MVALGEGGWVVLVPVLLDLLGVDAGREDFEETDNAALLVDGMALGVEAFLDGDVEVDASLGAVHPHPEQLPILNQQEVSSLLVGTTDNLSDALPYLMNTFDFRGG